jgi:hypothetical protein
MSAPTADTNAAAQASAPATSSTSATADVASGIVKLTVALPQEAVEEITSIAEAKHKTRTQVLREAIALKSFVERELADPQARLLVERSGTTREIVFT